MVKTTDLMNREAQVPENRWRKGDDSTIKSPALKAIMWGGVIFLAYVLVKEAGLVDKVFAAFAQ